MIRLVRPSTCSSNSARVCMRSDVAFSLTCLKLLRGQGLHRAFRLRKPVQVIIMENNGLAVSGQLHIAFNGIICP